MRIKPRFLIGGGLIAGAIVYLIITAIRNTAEYYLTVSEVAASADTLKGQPLRIAGRVKPGSVSWDPSSLKLVFTIVPIPDAGGAKSHAMSVDGAGAAGKAGGRSATVALVSTDNGYAADGKSQGEAEAAAMPEGQVGEPDRRRSFGAHPAAFVVISVGQPKPDMFAENRDVIVEGKLISSRTVAADQVLTSCPSKYVPETKK
jgi:cytochrome c-type biogenesis protein CcmE